MADPVYHPCVPAPTQQELDDDRYYSCAMAFDMAEAEWESLPITERVRLTRKVDARDASATDLYKAAMQRQDFDFNVDLALQPLTRD